MFQERNQSRCHGNQLLGADFHIADFGGIAHTDIFGVAHVKALVQNIAFGVQRLVCLGNNVFIFFVGSQVINLVGNLAVDNFSVRCFDKAVFVDTGIGRKRTDQTDVGTFGSFDGAHSAIVAVVYVTNLKACSFSGQTAWSQGGQTAFVS